MSSTETMIETPAPNATAQLDAVVLFLDALAEAPAFHGKREGLELLQDVVRAARDESEARTGEDYDDEGFLWLESLGLFKGAAALRPYEPNLDLPSGADVVLLHEKLESLAQEVIGVRWDAEAGTWVDFEARP